MMPRAAVLPDEVVVLLITRSFADSMAKLPGLYAGMRVGKYLLSSNVLSPIAAT